MYVNKLIYTFQTNTFVSKILRNYFRFHLFSNFIAVWFCFLSNFIVFVFAISLEYHVFAARICPIPYNLMYIGEISSVKRIYCKFLARPKRFRFRLAGRHYFSLFIYLYFLRQFYHVVELANTQSARHTRPCDIY